MIEIDGSYLEGGGQILRTSLTLSAILQRSFRIVNIRKGRKNPGLQAQHLTCVNAMKKICNASVEGNELHSEEIIFIPKKVEAGNYVFDVSEAANSAGSVSLVFQTVLLPLALTGKSEITLRGGTHVSWSPSFDYLKEVFLKAVEKMGIDCEIQINKYGWYPIGKGEIEAEIEKIEELKSISLRKRGNLKRITGCSIISNLPEHIAERQKTEALKNLAELACKTEIETINAPSEGKGTCVFLCARYENISEGFFALGEIGKSAEKVAQEAANALKEFEKTNATADAHLADQLMIYGALAKGETKYKTEKATKHLLTNAYTIGKMLPEVKIEIHEEGEVTIKGIGIPKE